MEGDSPARRLALLVEYQGTAYGGSQYQKNAPTVQGALERALSSLTGEPIRVALAGRTDAGVHASGQVASFLTSSGHPLEVFRRAANALLPKDVAVRAAAEVPRDFDPRRHATGRWYRYLVHTAAYRPALLRHCVWHVGQKLDLGAMSEGTAALPGRHDFRAFTAPSEAKRRATQRQVSRASLRQAGKLLVFDIEASSFLPHMVRRIMGALVETGLGKREAGSLEALLRRGQPGEASYTAPARGLCLMKVRYQIGLFDDETDENL